MALVSSAEFHSDIRNFPLVDSAGVDTGRLSPLDEDGDVASLGEEAKEVRVPPDTLDPAEHSVLGSVHALDFD
jgi:hypothetical protein